MTLEDFMNRIALSLTLSFTFAACATAPAPVEAPKVDPHAADRAAAAELVRNFQRVHFEFDSALITKDSADALAKNVGIMRRHPKLDVEVEGHCDETGSVEYNLALGQRRADSIQKYMVSAGLDGTRVRTISYGEEIPVSFGPEAHAKNRRAEFRVNLKKHPLVGDSIASYWTGR